VETPACAGACYGASVNGTAAVDERADDRDDAAPAPGRPGRALLRYYARLRPAQYVLWCYLVWYLVALLRYFDPHPTLWLSSLGISAIVGTALYLSTARAGQQRVRLERWQLARLFIMPFCVSSFAALIKGRGFILVFHPSLRDNVVAASACALFVAGSVALRRFGRL
jgi:hypothetical protein